MIDAITGKVANTSSIITNPGREYASAPDELPALVWHSVMPMGEGHEDLDMTIAGNVGEYYTHIFHNEKPSATFNSGFYAGVLAVKAGLVDPETFHHDNEPKQPPIASTHEA